MFRSVFVLTMAVLLSFAGPVAAEPVPIDISAGFNFDAVATQTELDTALAWHTAAMGDGTDFTLQTVFGETGTGDFTRGVDHHFANAYWGDAFFSDGTAAGLGQTVTTPFGTYTMGAFEGNQDLAGLTLGANAIRMGTERGKYLDDELAISTVTVDLIAEDQQAYSTINMLMTGANSGSVTLDNYGVDVPKKRAWFEVTAHYGDGSSELVWTSPKGGSYTHTNDVTYDIAGGIPLAFGFAEAEPNIWDPAYITHFNTVLASTMYTNAVGGSTIESPRHSQARSGELFMYDVAGGIPVDNTKTLTALTFTVTNGANTWPSGYVEGDHVNVYAVVGEPAGGSPDPIPGDANKDGTVDLEDFVILKTNFGTGTIWDEGDFDSDGDVDLDDFVILKTNFGNSAN